MKKLTPICAVLVMLIASVAVAHIHHGNSNESVTPTQVLPGDTIDVDFDYEIEHFGHQPTSCPWEVWLDGTAGTRDGVLLASGTNENDGYSTLTFHVDADGLTIPLVTTPGAHTVKIVTDVDAFEAFPEYSYLEITVGPLEVVIDIKPGSCPNPFNGKSKGSVPVAILGSEDFDVTTIDPTSLKLNGIPVVPENVLIADVTEPGGENTDCFTCFEEPDPIYEDEILVWEYTGDGFDDLIIKFDTQALAAAIAPVNRDDCVGFVLTGRLLDGTPIEGSDTMVIKTKIK